MSKNSRLGGVASMCHRLCNQTERTPIEKQKNRNDGQQYDAERGAKPALRDYAAQHLVRGTTNQGGWDVQTKRKNEGDQNAGRHSRQCLR